MNEYELVTRQTDGKRYTTLAIEDTQQHIWFVNHADEWCHAFLNKDTKCFVLRDRRSRKWVKRPIAKLEFLRKTHNKFNVTPRYFGLMHIPISMALATSMEREDKLFEYLQGIIKKNDLPLVILGNGFSGKDIISGKLKEIRGDILIHSNKNPKIPSASIEHLNVREYKENKFIPLEKDILKDWCEVRKVNRYIRYIIAYLKCEDEDGLFYGFVRVNKTTKHLFENKKKLSFSKLAPYELDITTFLKQLH